MAALGLRTAHSFIPAFELGLEQKRLSVQEFAKRLGAFFLAEWRKVMPDTYEGPPMSFLVAGYDEDAPYGSVFLLDVPHRVEPVTRNPDEEFGMTWGGQLEVVSRLIKGYDPQVLTVFETRYNIPPEIMAEIEKELAAKVEFKVPFKVLPLQDCINLAALMLRTTMSAQSLSIGIRGVGGPVEIAIVTESSGLQVIQGKVLHGEFGDSTLSSTLRPFGTIEE